MKNLLYILTVFGFILYSASDVLATNAEMGWYIMDNKNNLNMQIVEEENVETEEVKYAKEKLKSYESLDEEYRKNKGFLRNNRSVRMAMDTLRHEHLKKENRNILLSPLSFYASSVVLANGIVDRTLYEFSKVVAFLHLGETTSNLKRYLDMRQRSVKVMTSLWGNAFNTHYRKLISRHLGTEIWGLKDSTNVINNWIANYTKENDSDFLSSQLYNENEIFVVSTAVFEEDLKYGFDVANTVEKSFHNLDQTDGKVDMMNLSGLVDYYEDDFMKAIRLYYKNDNFITFYLPRKNVDFNEFLQQADLEELKPQFIKNVYTNVFIPRFEMYYRMSDLKNFYQNYGVKSVFEKSHDFAKMVDFDSELNVNDVVLVSKFAFKENPQGTKVENNIPKDVIKEDLSAEKIFMAHRPFVFMINDGDFIGAYVTSNKVPAVKKLSVDSKVSD